ncbi:hypothetical protein GAB14E_4284 [Colwellia psychrerythraea]|uniref:Uncharacterized protein n=1 Tax=Colwellia psychrerythraea TaxID=28229 RepID=A0A099KC58_COLPS|nr:hypothetical protein GAB14E_4284 [Colwellia psychrerythraea]
MPEGKINPLSKMALTFSKHDCKNHCNYSSTKKKKTKSTQKQLSLIEMLK